MVFVQVINHVYADRHGIKSSKYFKS